MMRAGLILGAVMAGSGPALAHPHIWIDTKIEVIVDAGNAATALRISWTYDDLYSLYIIGDMGLDPDGDDRLTPDEEARLSGFDMGWDADFLGDTYALQGEAKLDLSRPTGWTASYAGGRITSTHLRTFAAPVPLGAVPLVAQAYDPGFYSAYAIDTHPVVTGGAGCVARTYAPDLAAADQALQAALAEYTADQDLEAQFPAVGEKYADEVRVTCGAP